MPERIQDRLFFIRWAMRHNTLPFADVVVLPFLDSELSLHLSNVDGRNLESVFIDDIGLYIIICRFIVMNS